MDKIEEKTPSDVYLDWLTKRVEDKMPPSKDEWLTIAFKLNLFCLKDEEKFNQMNQDCAIEEDAVLEAQDKRNVAAAELKLRTTDKYRLMKNQQAKIDVIKQFIMIAKKNSDNVF